MRFLADESCDFSVVRALRSADHDVVAIAEVSPREEDDAVMERAVRAGRILVTEDKDFGQLDWGSGFRTLDNPRFATKILSAKEGRDFTLAVLRRLYEIG